MPDTIEKTSLTHNVIIKPAKFSKAAIEIRGTSPYMQNRFSEKARAQIEAKHREGSRSRKGQNKEARLFEDEYEGAKHISREGWPGIPAPAFRDALISACRLVGFAMTRAKLSIFVEADGYDAKDLTPLVRIYGEPTVHEAYVRNESGVVDLRWRPVWSEWHATVRLRWDADQFGPEDIINLFARAGAQVGVGEGRPDSPNSNGQDRGLWELVPTNYQGVDE